MIMRPTSLEDVDILVCVVVGLFSCCGWGGAKGQK